MILTWTQHGLSDLVCLHDFLHPVNSQAAGEIIQAISHVAEKLLIHACMGEKLTQYEPREVRYLIVGHYEMRYEIVTSTIYILRLWHTREYR